MCGVYIGDDEVDGDDECTFLDFCKPGGDTPKGLEVGVDTPCSLEGDGDTSNGLEGDGNTSNGLEGDGNTSNGLEGDVDTPKCLESGLFVVEMGNNDKGNDNGNFKGGGGGPPIFNPRGFLSRGDLLWVGKPGMVERQENFGGWGSV